jgi:PilZ domain-containing protein
MRKFGKARGGGRRRAQREAMPRPAVVSTLRDSRVAVLVDLSATGARLGGRGLPPCGEVLSLKIDCVRAFGSIAWTSEAECGVEFDVPLPSFEVDRLRRDMTNATLTYSLDEKLAVDDWAAGVGR